MRIDALPKNTVAPSNEIKIHTVDDSNLLVNENLQTKKQKISLNEIKDAINQMNKTTRVFNRSLHYKLHEASKRWQVQVIDTVTGKVLREIPPKEILDIVAQFKDVSGILVDKRR